MRTAREWRPLPLLCKRLDVMDPYRGKKAPLEVAAPKQVRRVGGVLLICTTLPPTIGLLRIIAIMVHAL